MVLHCTHLRIFRMNIFLLSFLVFTFVSFISNSITIDGSIICRAKLFSAYSDLPIKSRERRLSDLINVTVNHPSRKNNKTKL